MNFALFFRFSTIYLLFASICLADQFDYKDIYEQLEILRTATSERDAEKAHSNILKQKEFGKNDKRDSIYAEAHFLYGMSLYRNFVSLSINKSSTYSAKEFLLSKTQAFAKSSVWLAKSAEMKIPIYTLSSAYYIGSGFLELTNTVRNMPILTDNKTGIILSKMKILESLFQYFNKAEKYYKGILEDQALVNTKSLYVDSTKVQFSKVLYLKGYNFEEIDALHSELMKIKVDDSEVGQMVKYMQNEYQNAKIRALECYTEGIKRCENYYITPNQSGYYRNMKSKVTQ
jgi:hypothetical protein